MTKQQMIDDIECIIAEYVSDNNIDIGSFKLFVTIFYGWVEVKDAE